MPLQQTSGNDTSDAYGGGKAVVPNYIEDVFSTWLYNGTGAAQTITNNIDVSTKGGLTWCKARSNPYDNYLFDTARGANNYLISNGTGAQNAYGTYSNLLTSFNTNGFSLGADSLGSINVNNVTYASWTFRKQPKFFDVVTYTGTGANTTIAHSLGSVPGCIIVKRTDTTGAWQVYHSSLANTEYLVLNTTAAKATGATRWNSTTPTSTVFSVGTDATVNASGSTYVAYLFASNAGGFGAAGTDNVITCGSFTTDANGYANINLGYEPQWVMYKVTDTTGNWGMGDVMRGMPANTLTAGAGGDTQRLFANTSAAETTETNYVCNVTSTGFAFHSGGYASSTFIYIAIRRGPMATPTDATKVFSPQIYTGTSATRTLTTAGFPVDLVITDPRSGAFGIGYFDRLRGATNYLNSAGTGAEAVGSDSLTSFASMNGYTADADSSTALINYTPNYVNWLMRRAPGFFDEVCYTGTGTDGLQVAHNLGVAPELIILKGRTGNYAWQVSVSSNSYDGRLYLNTNAALFNSGISPVPASGTSSYITLRATTQGNGSNQNYVGYLFATVAGVSKVGSYTGNGTTQTINCGFTGGARFVLIKRTDSTGDWYVYDTARGMTTLTDPYLLLNSSAAETATLGSVTTVTTGFALNSTILANINISAATYIFLAIA
jgi:hypothetical protein